MEFLHSVNLAEKSKMEFLHSVNLAEKSKMEFLHSVNLAEKSKMEFLHSVKLDKIKAPYRGIVLQVCLKFVFGVFFQYQFFYFRYFNRTSDFEFLRFFCPNDRFVSFIHTYSTQPGIS